MAMDAVSIVDDNARLVNDLVTRKEPCMAWHNAIGPSVLLSHSTNPTWQMWPTPLIYRAHTVSGVKGVRDMSHWVLGSKPDAQGVRALTIDFQNDDSIGKMTGTLVFQGVTYYVEGNWAASGSIPGRNHSAFALWGSDQQAATVYVAVAGTMDGPGAAPDDIDLNLIRVSTGDDEQYGWSGRILPM